MAVIDVAGFVADLKDHAVDHGFHVHDERHFVETYSLRQAWEVDLHPEEACGGPLDLHLVARGRPAGAARRSRTRCSSCPTTRSRPTSSTFPLHVHLDAAAAARRPRPAGARHRAGRRRRHATCRSRCRPSTRSPRSPTRPSAASRSSPASRSSLDRVYPRRGAALRHARPLPRGEPVPARPRAQLARRGLTRPDARGISRHFAVTRRTDRTI